MLDNRNEHKFPDYKAAGVSSAPSTGPRSRLFDDVSPDHPRYTRHESRPVGAPTTRATTSSSSTSAAATAPRHSEPTRGRHSQPSRYAAGAAADALDAVAASRNPAKCSAARVDTRLTADKRSPGTHAAMEVFFILFYKDYNCGLFI